MTKSLDLGCGRVPKNTFGADQVFGIDFGMRPDLPPNIRLADLVVDPIPFEDDSFEFVTAHDFIEHVPRVIYNPTRRNPFVELMSEVWRVLKMNGTFLSMTPAYPNSAAFIDASRAVYELLGAKENVSLLNHRQGHRYPAEAQTAAEELLGRHLKR